MSGRGWRWLAPLACLLAVGGAVEAAPIQVRIVEPVPGQPAMGRVEVVVVVVSAAAVESVQCELDGTMVETQLAPPFRFSVDLGTDNVRHRLRIVARDVAGGVGEAEVTTAAIPDSGSFTISLQQMYVTVTRDGGRVLDLGVDDFSVRDDGDRQQVVTFARGDIPFTAVLLLDSSSSMAGARLDAARAGARSFVSQTQELDEVSVIGFSDRVLERTGFGLRGDELDAALGGLQAQGGTALHDHLYLALKLLERQQGRRVVVLLSDGIDSLSVLSIDDVVRKLRQSQALVYWIWLGHEGGGEFDNGHLRPISSTWRTPEEYRRQFGLLQDAVRASGGRIIPISDVSQIEPVFLDVLRELREQYVLGYYPSNERNNRAWHRVKVGVRGAGLDARTAEGYIDF